MPEGYVVVIDNGGREDATIWGDILTEIAAEEGLSFSLALIQADQDKTYLKQRLREGRIKPLKRSTISMHCPIPSRACSRGWRQRRKAARSSPCVPCLNRTS